MSTRSTTQIAVLEFTHSTCHAVKTHTQHPTRLPPKATAVIMTKGTNSTNTRLFYLPGHWPGLNALAVVACYWSSYRSVSRREEPVLAHENTAVLRIGRRGPDNGNRHGGCYTGMETKNLFPQNCNCTIGLNYCSRVTNRPLLSFKLCYKQCYTV